MKRTLLFSLPALLVIGAACFAGWWFRTPFNQRYKEAVQKVGSTDKDRRAALPILTQAAHRYKGTPAHAEAVYQLARCVGMLDPTNAAHWTEVLAVHSGRAERAEARLNLALLSADRETALASFAREFPEQPAARKYLLDAGEKALAARNTARALEAWQQLADLQPGTAEADAALDKLGMLNMETLVKTAQLPFTTNHTVARGENPILIARKHHVTAESIKRINGLSRDIIAPGVRLKIDLSRYMVEVSTSNHVLTLWRVWNGSTNFVKRYPVGTGKTDNTPRGQFKIVSREKNPTWHRPGGAPVPFGSKENLLGTRWLGIDCAGFGIHGTWAPETIGKASSAGCIRMHNADVEELFDLVSSGTSVTIHD